MFFQYFRKLRALYFLFIGLFFQCISAPKVAGQFTDEEFDSMADQMSRGDVDDIEVKDLQRDKASFIILDTRERNEFDISHIPGSKWVGYDDFAIERLKHIPKDAQIVTYCSVGYRSERIGEKLQAAGYSSVKNLKGSIFKWVNEGYGVVDKNQQPTSAVHGYDTTWGKWVRKKVKVVYE